MSDAEKIEAIRAACEAMEKLCKFGSDDNPFVDGMRTAVRNVRAIIEGTTDAK